MSAVATRLRAARGPSTIREAAPSMIIKITTAPATVSVIPPPSRPATLNRMYAITIERTPIVAGVQVGSRRERSDGGAGPVNDAALMRHSLGSRDGGR